MNLSNITAVVSDMDGVIWRGDDVLPGAITLFEMLQNRNIPFVLATNNSRRSRSNYQQKLQGMHFPKIPSENILTSGVATASYMQTKFPVGSRVYVVGGDGLREVLVEAGFVLADRDVQAVVVGIDFEMTYAKMRRAALLIRGGAAFIGTNPDVTFPEPEGLVPGAGSLVAMLRVATDVQPVVIGKPEPEMFTAALRVLNASAENTLMIGDRLGTDILGANKCGMKTALVLTGVSIEEELADSHTKPDAIYAGLPELMAAWEQA